MRDLESKHGPHSNTVLHRVILLFDCLQFDAQMRQIVETIGLSRPSWYPNEISLRLTRLHRRPSPQCNSALAGLGPLVALVPKSRRCWWWSSRPWSPRLFPLPPRAGQGFGARHA
jgi:hypothetical protein